MALELKTTHKAVRDYYLHLAEFQKLGVKHEGAVRAAFQRLLEHCCRQVKLTFVGEYKLRRQGRRPISVDGAVLDSFKTPHGFWEAKDTQDDLAKEVESKFRDGYPKDNILFQAPTKAILWQNSVQVCDEDITKPDALVYVVRELFAYRTEIQRDWEIAVEEFKKSIPDAAGRFIELIEEERRENPRFAKAFNSFGEVCRSSINPNLSEKAIEEMLIQHLLTERIFRKVFQNPDFTRRNIIAHEIDKVIEALVSRKFDRDEFLRPLDRFYVALEERAESLGDYHQKQTFLNTVYEKFFQGYAVKVADTHGIVYTPQPIVDFMVRSVEEILKKEFGRSLSDQGVHIIDPFVGTGNFITRIMREIKTTALPHKYANELHCNEVMLLPYYIASMNIEHEYYERTDEYRPFEGICLVDTFQLAEQRDVTGVQPLLGSEFNEENAERIERLRNTKLFVVIGNPPYNARQVNENDNNKNRTYKVMDRRIKDTYSKDGMATNKNALSDPYIRAIRWAADKVLENGEGIVAFVSNSSFIHKVAFDGMRKHLANDFSLIYVLDLKGYARTSGEMRRREKGNVFDDTIRVGISISLFVKKRREYGRRNIFYSPVADYLTSQEKRRYLEQHRSLSGVEWQQIQPDTRHTWLTEGLTADFSDLMPIGSRETKAGYGNALFRIFSSGVKSNRDPWVYNYNARTLADNILRTVETYNEHLWRLSKSGKKPKIDEFVDDDEAKISWSEGLKASLERGTSLEFREENVRRAMYRPFVEMNLYFQPILCERRYQIHKIFPTFASQSGNRVICVTGIASRKPFHCLVTNKIPDLHLLSDTQCFPFYVYDEDGTNARENITDWAAEQFSAAIGTRAAKWDIFYYVYGLLHASEYGRKYAANLRRELPRIPLPKDLEYYQQLVAAGSRLAELHVNYEAAEACELEKVETPGKRLDWRVEKMRLTKDRTAIIYNDFLTLAGIPAEAFEYSLRNKSPLEWIIDRYQVRKDKRSAILNDPNRPEDPQYIVRLIGKVITVSLETVKIVKGLPEL